MYPTIKLEKYVIFGPSWIFDIVSLIIIFLCEYIECTFTNMVNHADNSFGLGPQLSVGIVNSHT